MNNTKLLKYLQNHPESSREQIAKGIQYTESESSLKRLIAASVEEGSVIKIGNGRNSRYSLNNAGTQKRLYPAGIQTYEKIISEGYIYVDKTDLVYDLVHSPIPYLFLSRPRRFGKSLLISTIKAYFEGRKNLFRGQSIYNLEKDWETFPVIRLDLSTAGDAMNAEQLYEKLGNILRENEEDFGLTPQETLPGERLYQLVKRVHETSGKKVVLLIDEYDAPLMSALYDETREDEFKVIVKELFSPIKKLDPILRFTFLTGITKFNQMSIFSTLNNLRDISMDDHYATICGFTEAEMETIFGMDIDALAVKEGLSSDEAYSQLKQRYDGYHFSGASEDIYNPYSILRVFSEMKMNNYWYSSGTPGILFDTLKKFDTDLYEIDGVEVLASAFNQPAESATNALPIFYQSGYLTIKSYAPQFDSYILGIPNSEVRSGLTDNLLPIELGKSAIESQNVAIRFKKALVQEDINAAMDILKGFFASIPYPEFGAEGLETFSKKESYFKRLFYLVFSFMNVQIHTEVMNSEGRTDAIMYLGDTVYVIEAKLDAPSARAAIEQIDEKGYTDRFLGTPLKVKKLGLNFSSKTRTLEDWVLV